MLLHGFTGSAAGWAASRRALAPEFTTLAIDIVGHGQSDAPEDVERYRMRRCADDLAAVRARARLRPRDVARLLDGRAHRAAGAPGRPGRRRCAGPRGRHAGTRARRRSATTRVAADEVLAQRVEHEGVEAFIDYWQAIPLFESQRRMPQEAQDRVRAGRLQESRGGPREQPARHGHGRRRTMSLIVCRACACRRC